MTKLKKEPSFYRYVLGYIFLFFGLISGFLPILQGWIFVVIGVVLLKDDRWARKVHLYIQRRYPESRPDIRKFYKKVDDWLEKWWGL